MTDPHIVEVRRCSRDVSWRTRWDFVEVSCSDGTVGVGEWSDAGAWQLARPYFDDQAARLRGLTLEAGLAELELVITRTAERDPDSRRRLELTVLGGLDAALCDLAAQHDGDSLSAWFSGGVDPASTPASDIVCYGNINRAVHIRTADRATRIAKRAVEAGFTRLKFAPFDFLVGARRISAGLELAAAVREVVGSEVELMLDLHNHLSVEEILAVGKSLAELEPAWLEDVGSLPDVEAHRRVRAELGIPLAVGEFAASPRELSPLLEAGVVDFVMPDVKHSGGPRRAYELALFAYEHGVAVSPHNPTGPISSAHTAMLCRALPSYAPLELAVLESEDRATIVEPAERVVAGAYRLPCEPGLGFRLADDEQSEENGRR